MGLWLFFLLLCLGSKNHPVRLRKRSWFEVKYSSSQNSRCKNRKEKKAFECNTTRTFTSQYQPTWHHCGQRCLYSDDTGIKFERLPVEINIEI